MSFALPRAGAVKGNARAGLFPGPAAMSPAPHPPRHEWQPWAGTMSLGECHMGLSTVRPLGMERLTRGRDTTPRSPSAAGPGFGPLHLLSAHFWLRQCHSHLKDGGKHAQRHEAVRPRSST